MVDPTETLLNDDKSGSEIAQIAGFIKLLKGLNKVGLHDWGTMNHVELDSLDFLPCLSDKGSKGMLVKCGPQCKPQKG